MQGLRDLPFNSAHITHWNPGCAAPLIIPVHIVCNVPVEVVDANIRANSAVRGRKWQAVVEAHEGIAVLCGSGPSLGDTIEDIRAMQAAGGTVFAMNGAAQYLHDHGVTVDYQVMIDARPETAGLIGPARQHLFASQVSPACFERVPDAILWQAQVEGIDDLLPTDPAYDGSYCLIGGGASVGNTATCLAYAMGFRRLECFGYDSSHRDGAGHAFPQPLNDGDPCVQVEFGGKTYVSSLTMRLQAERFQETARHLERAGCVVRVHGSGLLPDIWNAPVEQLSEREKYERMWAIPAYRIFSPGADLAPRFLEIVKPEAGETVADFGSGTGRAALAFAKAGLVPLLIDFAPNSRDPAAMHLPFLEWDLAAPMPARTTFGFCADVMEHIATDDVDRVLANIFECAPRVFFQISTVHDNFGAAINQELHLTVKPHAWWRERLGAFGKIAYEHDDAISSVFYVTRQ